MKLEKGDYVFFNSNIDDPDVSLVVEYLLVVREPTEEPKLINPNIIEPEAPRALGYQKKEIKLANTPERIKNQKNRLLPIKFSSINPNKIKANKL